MAQSERHRQHRRVRETPAARYAPSSQSGGVAGILLDSDVVIEILRGRSSIADRLAATEMQGLLTYCCPITWAEIAARLRPGEETATEGFFEARGEVVIDAATGRRAGSYLSRYARSHGVEIADALIAAAASTSGMALWTLDRKHYPMKDLRLYNPPRT